MKISSVKCMLHIGLVMATVLSMAGCSERQSGVDSSDMISSGETTVRENVLPEQLNVEGQSGLTVANQEIGQRPGFDPSDLKPAGEITIRRDVLLELSEQEGKPCLTLTNHGQETLMHGNAGSAALQVYLDGTWYYVPTIPGWGHTDEGYNLEPEQSYSGTFFWDAYGELPDGDYRLIYGFVQDYPDLTYAVTEFHIENGTAAN